MSKISVIVPVYKAEKYIRRCVESILNQTISDLELILVDDGSPDNSGSICDEYAEKDSRVKVIHKENGGAASARNAGIKNATGEYLGFCDADDCLDLNMYETLLNAMLDENLLLIDCNSKVYSSSGELFYTEDNSHKLTFFTKEEALKRIFTREGNVSLCTKLIKRELFSDISIEEGRRVEDFYTTFLLLLKVEEYVIYNYSFYNYHTNCSSVTHSASGDIYLDAIYFYNKSIEMLRVYDIRFEAEENYYLLKMLYLLFISSNMDEWKKNKAQMRQYKKQLIEMRALISENPYLTSKEKAVLKTACISARLPRLIYVIKNGVKGEKE